MRDGENKVEILKFDKPLVNHFHPLHIRDRDLNDETRNKPRLKRLWKRSICFDYGLCIQQMRSQVIVQLRLFFRLYCLLFGPSNRTETQQKSFSTRNKCYILVNFYQVYIVPRDSRDRQALEKSFGSVQTFKVYVLVFSKYSLLCIIVFHFKLFEFIIY